MPDEFIPDPLKSYNPKQPNVGAQTPLAAPKAFIPDLTDDQLRQMSREKLSELLQTMDSKTSPSLLLSVIRETMDRLDGKPTQSVNMKVENKGLDQLSTEKLLRLAAMMDDPVIIAPLPKALDVD